MILLTVYRKQSAASKTKNYDIVMFTFLNLNNIFVRIATVLNSILYYIAPFSLIIRILYEWNSVLISLSLAVANLIDLIIWITWGILKKDCEDEFYLIHMKNNRFILCMQKSIMPKKIRFCFKFILKLMFCTIQIRWVSKARSMLVDLQYQAFFLLHKYKIWQNLWLLI